MAANPQDVITELERRDLSPAQRAAMTELKRRIASGAGPAQPSGMPVAAPVERLPIERSGLSTSATTPSPSMPETGSTPVEKVGILATGFNEGLAHTLGIPVDTATYLLEKAGMPDVDTPFMGGDFIQKYIMPKGVEPKTAGERIIKRTGEEIGATLPFAVGITAGVKLATDGPGMVNRILFELGKMDPVKLNAIQIGLATSAGATAGLAREIFPEGGKWSDFVGELIGSFGPTITIGLVKKALQVPGKIAEAVGIRSEEATREGIGKELGKLARPEKVEEGVKKAEELTEAVPGFKPTTGQAIGEPGLLQAERAQARASSEAAQKFQTRTQESKQAIGEFLAATAPEGKLGAVENQVEVSANELARLHDVTLARAQAKVDLAKGRLNAQTKQLVQDTERRMATADQQALERIEALQPSLTKSQAGAIVRQEYQQELAAYQAEASKRYAKVDREVPIAPVGIEEALADVQAEIRTMEGSEFIPSGVMEDLKQLVGTKRVAQAQIDPAEMNLRSRADVAESMVSQGDPGGKTFIDEPNAAFYDKSSRPGARVEGYGSTYPSWYGPLQMRKETVLNALEKIKQGKTGKFGSGVDRVRDAIIADRDLDALVGQYPETASTIQELRALPAEVPFGELDAVKRRLQSEIRAAPNDTVKRRLNMLLDGVEQDIDQLANNPALKEKFPDASANYSDARKFARDGIWRLKTGEADKLRQLDRTGRFRTVDENAASAFLNGEASLDDFVKAVGSRPEARRALGEQAKLDFYEHVVDPVTGKVNPRASAKWMQKHEAFLHEFPDLQKQFSSATSTQRQADDMTRQAKDILKDPEAYLRITDPKYAANLDAADKNMARVVELGTRYKKDFEKSSATLFLGADADRAAERILQSSTPATRVNEVMAILKEEPEAARGFQRAMWDAVMDKMDVRMMETSASPLKQSKVLSDVLTDNRDWMLTLFGKERVARLDTARDALDMLARSGRQVVTGGSDTAINLQSALTDFGPILSRFYAHQRGIVSMKWIIGERAARSLNRWLGKYSTEQSTALLEEAFFDPKVAQTLMMATREGANAEAVSSRIRAHLLNMNQLTERGALEPERE